MSVSRQTAFDFDLLQDRDYKYFCSTNDDGWLVGKRIYNVITGENYVSIVSFTVVSSSTVYDIVCFFKFCLHVCCFVGGGENGDSFKLENADSAHIEICRIGSFNEAWGGVPLSFLERIMSDGTIKIPVMAVLPTGIIENSDLPPEVEVRFDLKKIKINLDDEIRRIISNNRKIADGGSGCESADFENIANWQLRFVHNQLFHILENSNRFCPGAHHMTIVRKASWKNNNAKKK